MAFFQDSATLDPVLAELFRRTLADPDGLRELTRSGMRFLLDITEPAALISVNAKTQPPTATAGRVAGKFDLIIHTRMDVLHQVLLKELRLGDAFFGKKMKVEGSLLKARRLEGLFHSFQALYPQVLRDFNLPTTTTHAQA